MNETAVTEWMNRYLTAWESNSPDDIRAMFTDDAVYAFSPFDPEPLRGIEAIIKGWIESKNEPGTWSFTWKTLVVTDEVAIIEGETKYKGEADYSNLWVIRLEPDGRAREFTEWYMEHKD